MSQQARNSQRAAAEGLYRYAGRRDPTDCRWFGFVPIDRGGDAMYYKMGFLDEPFAFFYYRFKHDGRGVVRLDGVQSAGMHEDDSNERASVTFASLVRDTGIDASAHLQPFLTDLEAELRAHSPDDITARATAFTRWSPTPAGLAFMANAVADADYHAPWKVVVHRYPALYIYFRPDIVTELLQLVYIDAKSTEPGDIFHLTPHHIIVYHWLLANEPGHLCFRSLLLPQWATLWRRAFTDLLTPILGDDAVKHLPNPLHAYAEKAITREKHYVPEVDFDRWRQLHRSNELKGRGAGAAHPYSEPWFETAVYIYSNVVRVSPRVVSCGSCYVSWMYV